MDLFLQNMSTAAQQVFTLYIIVAAGFIADKLHIFTEKTTLFLVYTLYKKNLEKVSKFVRPAGSAR